MKLRTDGQLIVDVININHHEHSLIVLSRVLELNRVVVALVTAIVLLEFHRVDRFEFQIDLEDVSILSLAIEMVNQDEALARLIDDERNARIVDRVEEEIVGVVVDVKRKGIVLDCQSVDDRIHRRVLGQVIGRAVAAKADV